LSYELLVKTAHWLYVLSFVSLLSLIFYFLCSLFALWIFKLLVKTTLRLC
jgi:hypothetical protein